MLYLLGAAGESLRRVALDMPRAPQPALIVFPFVHWKYPNGVALGWSSRLPDVRGRHFQAIVLDWLKAAEPETVLVTGHHLANDTFLDRARVLGFDVTVGYLEGASLHPEEVAARELASRYATPGYWLDYGEPDAVRAARLRLHPVIQTLARPCMGCEEYHAARERRSSSHL